MEPTEEQLRITYKSMSTEKLLSYCQSGTLTPMAQGLAAHELSGRGISQDEINRRAPRESIDYRWRMIKVLYLGGAASVGGMFLLAWIPGMPNTIPQAWLIVTSTLVALRCYYWLFKD